MTESAAEAVGDGAVDEVPTALSVVRGEPTPEELAALIAVIASRRGGDDEEPAVPAASGWTDRARYVRTPVRSSPNGWRASALPR